MRKTRKTPRKRAEAPSAVSEQGPFYKQERDHLKRTRQLASIASFEMENIDLPGQAITEIVKEAAIGREVIQGVLGVGKSAYYALIKKPRLEVDHIDILSNFSRVWQKGLETFEGNVEAFGEFMHTRNKNLGGVKPITLITSESGRRELSEAFDRIEYDLYG